MSMDQGSWQTIPWKHTFFIPVLVYLAAFLVKGLRFAFLFNDEKRLRLSTTMPYQEALSLNNSTVLYFSDLFIYWFYKPFVPRQRLIGGIALARCADLAIIIPAFLYLGYSSAGVWYLLLAASLIWGALCFGLVLTRYKNLLRRRFTQVFVLSVLGWLLEWLALSLLFMFHRGSGDAMLSTGLKGVFNAYVLGPQLMFHWFFVVHFVVGFVSLLQISYRKD